MEHKLKSSFCRRKKKKLSFTFSWLLVTIICMA